MRRDERRSGNAAETASPAPAGEEAPDAEALGFLDRLGWANKDSRSEWRKDRDRILYSSSFRRLSGVTQVAAAAEGSIFHNRMTHSLEVAQVARGIADTLRARNGHAAALIERCGGLDSDVVEAAAMAHDLGHPPYGHLGESAINACVADRTGDSGDGFEGNAQTFRIVTTLAQRRKDMDGLDLTRATLNAILKYPWTWVERPADKPGKWGAYRSEEFVFDWVRETVDLAPRVKTLEAEIMDWADDITYALHDLEDFYRAGLIPLDILARDLDEQDRFVDSIFKRRTKAPEKWPWRYGPDETRAALDRFFAVAQGYGFDTPYDGTPTRRKRLREFISLMIGSFIDRGAALGSEQKTLRIDKDAERLVSVLKQLTTHYVINGPEVATQRRGQHRIITELFDVTYEAIHREEWWVFPTGYERVVEEAYQNGTPADDSRTLAARLAADFVSSLTEQQAVALHRRVTGAEMGRLMSLPV
jgi:dGTPase